MDKSDTLFRAVTTLDAEHDWATNARIQGTNDFAYAEGYRRAAQLLATYVINQQRDSDFLVYPITFLYRHNIELQFKRLIPNAAFLADLALPQGHERLLTTSHDLEQLWQLFAPSLRVLAQQDFGITNNEIDGIASYIQQIAAIDAGSFSFRYLKTKDGRLAIDATQIPLINVGILTTSMEKITAYFSGLSDALQEAVYIKCEMEAETRSDEARYNDEYSE
jgi:hypothetical protein